MNDYDQEGWVSMAHSKDRPLPRFNASFDETSGNLIADNELKSHSLVLDSRNGTLNKGELEYIKVK